MIQQRLRDQTEFQIQVPRRINFNGTVFAR
jgi:hypothetical protein